jgi:N-acetylneuraminic acid mutarotase
LFGGEYQTDLSNNHIYCFDFVSKNWKKIPSKADIPKVDSHCAVVVENKMYVYGGYDSDKAEYFLDVLSFNFDNLSWEIVYKGSKSDK